MRTGRPRLKNVARSPSGKSLGPQEIHPETLAARERELAADGIILAFGKQEGTREVIKRTADDRLSGFTLGRLLLRHRQDKSNPGGISEEQFNAGEEWGSIVRRHSKIMGYRLTIHTPSFVMVGGGPSNFEPDEDAILRIRSQWTNCYNAIMEGCAPNGLAIRNLLYGIVIENWPCNAISNEDYGLLRTGLNAIARALR